MVKLARCECNRNYLERGVPYLGDLPSCEGGVICGNLAGEGSKEGVSTEKTFSSANASTLLCFLGVIPFITSRSCKGYCSNNAEISFVEGRVFFGGVDFEFLFGEGDCFFDS